jgi:hypothetical protein
MLDPYGILQSGEDANPNRQQVATREEGCVCSKLETPSRYLVSERLTNQ